MLLSFCSVVIWSWNDKLFVENWISFYYKRVWFIILFSGLIKIFKVTMFYFFRKCNLRKRSFLTTFLYEYKLGRTWLETAITRSFYKTEINKLAQLLWNVSIQMVFNFDLKFLQISILLYDTLYQYRYPLFIFD